MGHYICQKVQDGYSTVFRQHKAEGTHCQQLHGYGVSVKFTWEAETLDYRNWVVSFGEMKHSTATIEGKTAKEWLSWLLDHTVVVAQDDPALYKFEELAHLKVLNLRVLESVGCEGFAKHIYDKFEEWTYKLTQGRCKLVSVEFKEHDKNSATYFG